MSELRDAIAAAIRDHTDRFTREDLLKQVLTALGEHTREEWGVARRHSGHGPWMFERTGSVALADEKIADCLAVYGYDHVTVARASRRVTAWTPVEGDNK